MYISDIVLLTNLWIPPFKRNMYQPSSIFVTREYEIVSCSLLSKFFLSMVGRQPQRELASHCLEFDIKIIFGNLILLFRKGVHILFQLNHIIILFFLIWKSFKMSGLRWFLVDCISSGTLRHKFRVPWPCKGGSQILTVPEGGQNEHLVSWNFFWYLVRPNGMGKCSQLIKIWHFGFFDPP